MFQPFDQVRAVDPILIKKKHDTDVPEGLVYEADRNAVWFFPWQEGAQLRITRAPDRKMRHLMDASPSEVQLVKRWDPEELYESPNGTLRHFARGYTLKQLPLKTKTYLIEDRYSNGSVCLIALRSVRLSFSQVTLKADLVSTSGVIENWRYDGRNSFSPDRLDFSTLRLASQEEMLLAQTKNVRLAAFNKEAPAVEETQRRITQLAEDLNSRIANIKSSVEHFSLMKGVLSGDFERSSDLRSEIKELIPQLILESQITETILLLERQASFLTSSVENSMRELKQKHNIPA